MNKDNRLYGIRDNGTVEGHYIETYYTPCKGIATDDANQLVRVIADNGATDVETRVLFSTLESDGRINPKEASDLRVQLAEARKDSERYSFLKMMHKDWDFFVTHYPYGDGVEIVKDSLRETVCSFVGATFDEAIDKAMKGGE